MLKRLIILGITVLLVCVGLSGCLEKNIIVGTGKIQYNDFEGGFYGIVSDDDEKYDPVNLPDEFKEDGLQVEFKLKILKNRISYHMWGKLVYIIEIDKLDS